MENCFYVYAILDPRKPGLFKFGKWSFNFEPFYIGKGKKNRWKDHVRACNNKHKTNKVDKIFREHDEIPVLVVKEALSENAAFALEVKLIKAIGRGKIGPLTNLTDGGEGCSGNNTPKSDTTKLKMRIYQSSRPLEHTMRIAESNTGKKRSEETKRKISKANTGKVRPKDAIEASASKIRGVARSSETREKIRAGNTGKVFSEQRKRNISEAKKGMEARNKRKVRIGKKIYQSLSLAAEAMGVTSATIHYRINSSSYQDHCYAAS